MPEKRGAKRRDAQWSYPRPFLGRGTLSAVVSMTCRRLWSEFPDLSQSGRISHHSYLPVVAAGAIDQAPDLDAFGLGVEVMIFVALFTALGLFAVNWIMKTIRGSDR